MQGTLLRRRTGRGPGMHPLENLDLAVGFVRREGARAAGEARRLRHRKPLFLTFLHPVSVFAPEHVVSRLCRVRAGRISEAPQCLLDCQAGDHDAVIRGRFSRLEPPEHQPLIAGQAEHLNGAFENLPAGACLTAGDLTDVRLGAADLLRNRELRSFLADQFLETTGEFRVRKHGRDSRGEPHTA